MIYKVKQKVFAFNTTFNIFNEQDEKLFRIKRRHIFSFSYDLQDKDNNTLMTIKRKLFHLLATFNIEKDGNVIAEVKAKFKFFESQFNITTAAGTQLTLNGNVFAHDYIILNGSAPVATISKKYFALRDSYAINVVDEDYAYLAFCLAAIADLCHHEEDNR